MKIHIKNGCIYYASAILAIVLCNVHCIAQVPVKNKTTDAKANNPLPKQSDKQTFLIRDSTFTPWIAITELPDIYNYNYFKSDTAGNLYCVADLQDNYSKKQLIRILKNGNSNAEVFETGIENTNYMSLQQDGNGMLYVKSDDGLYTLGNNKWEKVFAWYKGIGYSTPFPKADGGLYSTITDWNSPHKTTSIVKYENGTIKHLGKNGQPLQLLSSNDWFVVGRDGTIYSYYSHPSHVASKTKVTQVFRWNGSTWELTGEMPARITYIDFDPNNNLYAAGSNHSNDWFFKKWNGKTWTNVAIPDSLNKDRIYHPIFDEKKNVFMVGTKGITSILYKLENDRWIECAKSAEGLHIYISNAAFFPAHGQVYATGTPVCPTNRSLNIFRYETPRWVVTEKEVRNIPVMGPVLNRLDSLHLSNFCLFEFNGMKGVRNASGCQVIKPLFDEISIINNPKNLCTKEKYSGKVVKYESNYVFQMKKGIEYIYADFPLTQQILHHVTTSTCPTCNGSGNTGGEEYTKETKGEYVEEKTTQIKKLGINGWYWETTKTPGYYKDSKFEKKKTPIVTCSQCKGEKIIYFSDEKYDVNVRKKYEKIWGY